MKKKICIILIAAFVAMFGTSAYFIFRPLQAGRAKAGGAFMTTLPIWWISAAETEEEGTEPILYTEEKDGLCRRLPNCISRTAI